MEGSNPGENQNTRETLNPSNPAKYQVKHGTREVQIALESLYQKSSTNGYLDVHFDTRL